MKTSLLLVFTGFITYLVFSAGESLFHGDEVASLLLAFSYAVVQMLIYISLDNEIEYYRAYVGSYNIKPYKASPKKKHSEKDDLKKIDVNNIIKNLNDSKQENSTLETETKEKTAL